MAENKQTGPETEPTTYNLLFVCTGNTCRSPMAEAIARHAVEERDWTHVSVASAGIAAGFGSPAAESARQVARERGLDLEGHRSRPLTPEMIDWADLILVMAPEHAMAVRGLGAEEEKVGLVSEFTGDEVEEARAEIPDPFGGDVARYRTTFEVLERAVNRVLDRLEPILAP